MLPRGGLIFWIRMSRKMLAKQWHLKTARLGEGIMAMDDLCELAVASLHRSWGGEREFRKNSTRAEEKRKKQKLQESCGWKKKKLLGLVIGYKLKLA